MVRLSRSIGLALLALVVVTACSASAQKSIALHQALDRQEITPSETATLTITVEAPNQKQLPAPTLPPLEQFDIYPAGTAQNLQIINGAISYTQSYTFVLNPKREGVFPIRPSWVVIDGTRYESNSLTLKVAKAAGVSGQVGREGDDGSGNARDLFLTAEVDKKTAYVDEQVTLRIKFFRGVKLLSSPDYAPPQTPDFWAADSASQTQYYQTVNGRDYLVNEIRTALFPTKPGQLTVSPARVTATVPERSRRRSRDPFSMFDDIFQQGKSVEVSSRPLTIDVKPLPTEGKDSLFLGGVGNYKISALVDKTEAEVNEAVTLTIKISGRGNVKSIPEPALPQLSDFRVEKSASNIKAATIGEEVGGAKSFDYLLIPRLPGKQTIPPIILSYFDPETKSYQKVQTEPIVLLVEPSELASGTEIPYNMVTGQTLELNDKDIRFIKTDNSGWRRASGMVLTSPIFLTAMIVPTIAVFGGLVDVRRRRRLQGDLAYARKSRATSVARKRLKKAEELLSGVDHTAFYAELSGALLQYIADKTNRSAQGLISDQVDEVLRERKIAETLRTEALEVLKAADFGRFAGVAGESAERKALFEQARKTLDGLEDAL